MVDKVTDLLKIVTDPVLLSALARQGIDKDFVEFVQDYAPRSLGKGHSPYAKFYRDLNSNKRFMVVSGLPMVDADGILCDPKWVQTGNTYHTKSNVLDGLVNDIPGRVTLTVKNDDTVGRKKNDRLVYIPQLFLNGIEVPRPGSALLPVDPLNPNYPENTIEWDYGICKRRLRQIEGHILGSWVFPANPNGEVRIKYNQVGDYRLQLGEFKINDDEEVMPQSVFADAEYPFTVSDSATYYPDAVPSTSVDGLVADGTTAVWATLRAAPGTAAYENYASLWYIYIDASSGSGDWASLFRAIFLFDSSGLPDNAVISAATLSLYGNDKLDDLAISPQINIYVSAPATNTNVVAGDFDSLGATAFSTPITYANWSTVGYNDFILNATGLANISKTGVSPFGAREVTYDADGATPTWSASVNSKMNGYFSEQGNGYKPKLVVTYTVATDWTKSLADTLTLSDSPVKKPVKKPTDTLGLLDNLSKIMGYNRTLTDTLTLADSPVKKPSLNKADTLTLVDAPVKKPSLNKADTLTVNDSFSRTAAYNRAPSDTLSLLDSFSRIAAYNRTLTDTLGLVDALIKAVDLSKSDTMTLTDAIVKNMGKKPSDTLTLTDVFSSGVTYLRTLTDTLGMVDALVKGMGKKPADTLTLSDSFSRSAEFFRTLTDTLTLVDLAAKLIALTKSDSITLTDDDTENLSLNIILADVLKLSAYMITHHHHFGTGRESAFKGERRSGRGRSARK